jgi:hypothetical protein
MPNSVRYRVSTFGLRAALFSPARTTRILRPGVAATPGLQAIDTPLQRAFHKCDAQLTAWINQTRFAA